MVTYPLSTLTWIFSSGTNKFAFNERSISLAIPVSSCLSELADSAFTPATFFAAFSACIIFRTAVDSYQR